jgi:hypothetical protein
VARPRPPRAPSKALGKAPRAARRALLEIPAFSSHAVRASSLRVSFYSSARSNFGNSSTVPTTRRCCGRARRRERRKGPAQRKCGQIKQRIRKHVHLSQGMAGRLPSCRIHLVVACHRCHMVCVCGGGGARELVTGMLPLIIATSHHFNKNA